MNERAVGERDSPGLCAVRFVQREASDACQERKWRGKKYARGNKVQISTWPEISFSLFEPSRMPRTLHSTIQRPSVRTLTFLHWQDQSHVEYPK